MTNKTAFTVTMERLLHVKKQLIEEYPFFGELIVNLSMTAAEGVVTACTDGRHLIFDPSFVSELDNRELQFVAMHEVLHCVFLHCYRRGERDRLKWNIAADYVVNSNILAALGVEGEMLVAGEPVFHKLPNGEEAFLYTADEVYNMLTDIPLSVLMPIMTSNQKVDSHEIWDELSEETHADDMDNWRSIEKDAARKWMGKGAGIALGSLRSYEEFKYKEQLKWKSILRRFVSDECKKEECSGLRPPDRRFQDEEFFYPGINEMEQEMIRNIWFFADKSGSIPRKVLLMIMKEIEAAIRSADGLEGLLSFFDADVSRPKPFTDIKDFTRIRIPIPNGGTDFFRIFDYVQRNGFQYDPCGIIVMTDGYAQFPPVNPVAAIPVLWIIVDHAEAKPQFGQVIHMDAKD